MYILKLDKSNKEIKNIVWQRKEIWLSNRKYLRMCDTLYKINIKKFLKIKNKVFELNL